MDRGKPIVLHTDLEGFCRLRIGHPAGPLQTRRREALTTDSEVSKRQCESSSCRQAVMRMFLSPDREIEASYQTKIGRIPGSGPGAPSDPAKLVARLRDKSVSPRQSRLWRVVLTRGLLSARTPVLGGPQTPSMPLRLPSDRNRVLCRVSLAALISTVESGQASGTIAKARDRCPEFEKLQVPRKVRGRRRGLTTSRMTGAGAN